MDKYCFYCAGYTLANDYAVRYLQKEGCRFAAKPDDTVTHLLLPVPSLTADDQIRGGGSLTQVLSELPENVGIIGGNLPTVPGHKTFDLLQDPIYVAQNAYITAHCAVRLVTDKLPTTLRGCKVLVIGWGRIGKCLAALLKALEADVTVAARKETDRAILEALGYRTQPADSIAPEGYRVILNTVPVMVLPESPAGCLKIDLASTPGLGGADVLHARGLPGKDAPEASGTLIARTVMRLLNKEAAV